MKLKKMATELVIDSKGKRTKISTVTFEHDLK
jgi:hypothetical protein